MLVRTDPFLYLNLKFAVMCPLKQSIMPKRFYQMMEPVAKNSAEIRETFEGVQLFLQGVPQAN